MGEDINVTDEKPEDWKNKLSSAFNEDEIFYSLLVLGNFYVVYAIVKASFDVHDDSPDDEERFIQSCFCSFNQRFFYRFWFCFCFALWFLIHSYSYFAQLSVKRFHKFEDIIKVFLAFCLVCPCYSLCNYLSKSKAYEHTPSTSSTNIHKIKENLKLLWFQYCKLYVIGYTQYNDKEQSIKSIMKKNDNEGNSIGSADKINGYCFVECNKKGDNVSHCCCCFRCSKQCCCSSQSQGNETELIITCPEINVMCCNEYFSKRCLSKDIIRAILFAVKYISQLATVPLLLLQIFDTYSFLCFSPDSYCSDTTEYNQQLVQAAITMFFYCSLLISHLASTMLIWNPWPKRDKQSKLAPGNANKQKELKRSQVLMNNGASDSEDLVEVVRNKFEKSFNTKRSEDLVEEVRNKFEETFNTKYPWTIYFLIDLKVVYIITFGLITIINLISSTANIHASNDKNSVMLFNVSSKYMNVNVTSINDPVLWNCRRFSETSDSYKLLYWMVIIALAVIMSGLFLIKFISLIVVSSGCGFKCCSYMSSTFKHGLTKLWHMAIHQKLIKLHPDQITTDIDYYDEMLKEDIPDNIVKTLSCKNYCRSIIPYVLLVLSLTIMCTAYSSFDLHPLACIFEPDEELVTYQVNGKVELKFSTTLLIYQKTGAILVFCLGIVFLIFVRLFFYCTELVVEELQKKVKDNEKLEQENEQEELKEQENKQEKLEEQEEQNIKTSDTTQIVKAEIKE